MKNSFGQKLSFYYTLLSAILFFIFASFVSYQLNKASLPVGSVWIFSLASVCVTFFVGIYIKRSLDKQVRDITRVALKYAKGDLEEKIYVNSRDEFRVLGDVMNRMASSLRKNIRKITNERSELEAILANMNDAVVAVGARKKVLMVNPAFVKMFNIKEGDALNKSLLEVLLHPKIDDLVNQALDEKKAFKAEVQVQQEVKKIILVHAIGLKKGRGEVFGVLVMQDITALKKLQQMRQEFVANVSHELRTPLTSIKGFIETLQSGALKDEQKARHFLKIMEEDTGRLARLIDDLLVLSRLDSGEEPLYFGKFSILETIDFVLLSFQERLKQKQIQVIKEFNLDEKMNLKFDQDKLRQVMVNLIDNAIKFSPVGSKITLRTYSKNSFCYVSILDQGEGIPADAMPRLFERFYRVDKARSRELGGTGLGLAITKHIIERHGGKVICQSTLGQGAEFIFSLPLS